SSTATRPAPTGSPAATTWRGGGATAPAPSSRSPRKEAPMPLLQFLHDRLGLGDEGDDLEEEDLAPLPPPLPELTPLELAERLARGHAVAPRLRQLLALGKLPVRGAVTMRNWNTVQRLVEMLDDG